MNSPARIILGFVHLFIFLSSVNSVFAWSFSIESVEPNSISSKIDEVTVKLLIADLPNESYFRIAWQREGSNQYFGYVKNSDSDESWVPILTLTEDKSGHCAEYYKVSDTDISSITLVTKPGEDSDITAGTYFLKAHRFTSTCSTVNTADNNGSEETKIQVLMPTATPTPTNTPTPTLTPEPTDTPEPPTKTPKPPTRKPTVKERAADTKSTGDGGTVLAARSGKDNSGASEFDGLDFFLPTSSPSATPTAKLSPTATPSANTRKKVAYVFYALGALAITASGISAYKIIKSSE